MRKNNLRALEQASSVKLVLTFLKAVLLWLFAVFILFLIMEILPGDAASAKAGKVGPEALAALRHQMGLDRPFLERFFAWLTGLAGGNFGSTLTTGRNVRDIISTPLLSSMSLAAVVLLGLVLISVPLSVYCGYYKNTLSRIITKTAVLLSSVPEFVLTIAAIMILSLKLELLPSLSLPGPGKNVWQNPISMVMPCLCLWTICTATMFRYLRVMIEDHAEASYVREAFLAGLSRRRVLFVHLLPSALAGIAQIIASTVPYLLAGSMVVETLTSYPGMGYTLIQAVQSRETPIVMAIGSFLIASAIAFYFGADFLGRKNRRKGGI